MNLSDLVKDNVARSGEYTLLSYQDRTLSNRQLDQCINRVAVGLTELGVRPGDRVALVMGNSPELIVAMFACFKIGAWAMPVVFSLRPAELGLVLADAEPAAIVAHRLFCDQVQEPVKKCASVRFRIKVGKGPTPEGWLAWDEWTVGQSDEFEARDCEPDEVALLMYTSGTTGDPKGVMLSHLNLYSNAQSSCRSQGFETGEVNLLALPLNHSFGITAWFASLIMGMKVVLFPRFDPAEALHAIPKHRVTTTALVPTMLAFIIEAYEKNRGDVSSLGKAIVGAAPLRLPLRERFQKTFPRVQVLEAYGLTEASPAVTVTHPGEPVRPRSVGRSVEDQEICVQDEWGRELGPGHVGEVCTRGPHVMLGYYKKPKETRAVLRDGWLHTGDAGYLDEDGFLYLTERIKDLIIRGGENVYPSDVERAIRRHPGVAEVSAIGIPDEVYGEEVAAIVVKKPEAVLTESELIEFCRDNLAPFQVPRHVFFVHILPKTQMGKVRKTDLREHYVGADKRGEPK